MPRIGKGFVSMDPTVALVDYIGFVVAALIIIWAVIELGRRFYRYRRMNNRALNTWVRLNATRAATAEEPVLDLEDEQEDASEPDLHTRAQQNGHYSESKKPL